MTAEAALALYSAREYATKTLGGTTTFARFCGGAQALNMRKPTSISELLAQGKTKLQQLRSGADAAQKTLAAVQQVLPSTVASHVFAASVVDPTLTVLVDSGAFATRVRYALAERLIELAPALGIEGGITRTDVRVRPRQ